MSNIKCIGCYDLLREEMTVEGRPLIVYKCSRFPYACALSGLLRPGSAIVKMVEDCPEDPLKYCAICGKPGTVGYGQDIVATCQEHYDAWSKWLDEHPERRAHLSPQGRAKKANWIEVFREFVEDMRNEVKDGH